MLFKRLKEWKYVTELLNYGGVVYRSISLDTSRRLQVSCKKLHCSSNCLLEMPLVVLLLSKSTLPVAKQTGGEWGDLVTITVVDM